MKLSQSPYLQWTKTRPYEKKDREIKRHNNNYKKKQPKVCGSGPAQVRKPITPTSDRHRGNKTSKHQNEHQIVNRKSQERQNLSWNSAKIYSISCNKCLPNFPIKSYFLSDLVKVWPRIIMVKLHPPCHRSQIFCSIQFCPPTSLKHLTRQKLKYPPLYIIRKYITQQTPLRRTVKLWSRSQYKTRYMLKHLNTMHLYLFHLVAF